VTRKDSAIPAPCLARVIRVKWATFSALVLVGAALAPALRGSPAYACTLPANFDAVAASDVIVEGRILGWDEISASQIAYEIEVTRAFKGAAATGDVLAVTDFGSRLQGNWEATGGLCGTFSEDPAGKYVVIGLRGDAGSLSSTNQTRFFFGDEPRGPAYEAAIETVGDGAVPLPPDTGDENDEGSDDGVLWLVTAAGIGLAVGGAGLILFLRRRPTAG
jgi:hypothetical protein